MMTDENFLISVSENFEYEYDDDFENPKLGKTLMRGKRRKKGKKLENLGNRPGKKPGKNSQWKVLTDEDNEELGKVRISYK